MAKWKAIKVDVPNKRAFVGNVRSNIKKAVEEPKKDFESFVAPFSGSSKPTIIVKNTPTRSDEIGAFTGVESSWSKGQKAKPEDIFMFLTRGTSVRYATMDESFRSKTRRGRISSGGGGGRRKPLYITRDVPRDGIDARDIEEAVAKKQKKRVIKDIENVVKRAAEISKLSG